IEAGSGSAGRAKPQKAAVNRLIFCALSLSREGLRLFRAPSLPSPFPPVLSGGCAALGVGDADWARARGPEIPAEGAQGAAGSPHGGACAPGLGCRAPKLRD